MTKNLMIWLQAAAFVFASPAWAQSTVQSGVYEGLAVAISPAGDISGYFSEELGGDVKRGCSFFLTGKLKGTTATLKTWSDMVYPGLLRFEGQDAVLKIAKGRHHPGCASVMMPEIASGLSLEKTVATKWTAIRKISAAKAYFYAAPMAAKRAKAYVVVGDVVGVLQEKPGWLEVEYPVIADTRRKTWLRTSDTSALVAK